MTLSIIAQTCQKKINNDIRLIANEPLENILTYPDENNILLWYFMIIGPDFSKYKGDPAAFVFSST